MSTVPLKLVLEAIDEASAKIKQVGDNTEKAMKKVEESSEKAEFSMKKFAVSISGVMTAGFALYNAYDRIQDSQLAVKKAQDALTSAQISAKNAQEAYNRAVEKYGVDSTEAKDALEKLELAQDRVKTANEMLVEKQSRVNEAMINLAVQAIPTTITAINSLKGVVGELTASFAASEGAIAGVGSALGLLGGLIGGVVAAVGLMYIAWVEDWDGVRTKTLAVCAEIRPKLDELINSLNSFQEPLNNFAASFESAFQRASDAVSSVADDIRVKLDEIIAEFQATSEEIVGGSIWPEMWEEIINVTRSGMKENLSEIDRGLDKVEKMLARPFYMNFAININVGAIRAQIQKVVTDVLKSVTIEKTSAQAVTSRIRVPTSITPGPTPTTTTRPSPLL